MANPMHRHARTYIAAVEAGELPDDLCCDAITAEDNRVIAEARSRAVLIDGQTYENTYVFALTIRDGKFARIAEHYNALEVEEKLMPLMARLEADGQG
jgi:hypothetical protein